MGRRDAPGLCSSLRGTSHARGGVLAAAIATGIVGCGNSNPLHDAGGDAMGPQWWQPKIGQAKNWDIQLSGPIDVTAPRVMYDLDLWTLVPSPMMLDYGDGKPIMVPTGTMAGAIAQLHARTPQTIVICHIETGLLELGRPDAPKFLGYNADPTKIPDNPDDPASGATVKGPPATGSVIGWSLGGSNGGTVDRRLLDVRAASRASWAPIMWKRFDLAKQIGCDGVESAHNDAGVYISGFDVPSEDSFSWYMEVAQQGHDRKLSTGMRNGDSQPALIDAGASQFDWLMFERCGELGLCDVSRPFTKLEKAVLAIEFNTNQDTQAPQDPATVCAGEGTLIMDGLVKDTAFSKNVRVQCVP
jgi:hypothetical protein